METWGQTKANVTSSRMLKRIRRKYCHTKGEKKNTKYKIQETSRLPAVGTPSSNVAGEGEDSLYRNINRQTQLEMEDKIKVTRPQRQKGGTQCSHKHQNYSCNGGVSRAVHCMLEAVS